MENSRWSDIFKHLENAGYEVYPPSVKEGECTSPYVVVKDAGTSKDTNVSSSLLY